MIQTQRMVLTLFAGSFLVLLGGTGCEQQGQEGREQQSRREQQGQQGGEQQARKGQEQQTQGQQQQTPGEQQAQKGERSQGSESSAPQQSGESSQGTAAQGAKGASLEGTVVKMDESKKEIVLKTQEGEKTVQLTDDAKGVENAKEGAKVRVQLSEKNGQLKASEIAEATQESPTPRG